MSTILSASTRIRLALIFGLVAALLVPTIDEPAVAQSGSSWGSDFGGGSSAAFRSIGDGLASTGWNGRSNVSFGRYAGRDALSLRLPADARDGMKLRSRFSELGFPHQSGVRLEYDVFIASERDLALDLKLPGIASAPSSQSVWYASSGGTKQNDSGSLRLHLRPAGNWGVPHPYLEAYAYAHTGGGKTFRDWGLYWRLSEGLNATGSVRGDEFRVPIGEWFTVTMEAEMNSPGRRDGQLRVWLNDRKGIEIGDMEWVRSAPYVWTQTMFDVFYNTGSHPDATVRLANMSMRSIGEAVPVPAPDTSADLPEPPVASFVPSTTDAVVGQTVTFDATASQRAVSYAWDDAAPGDWPMGSGQTLEFAFRNPGTKLVRLTVTDEQGRTDTITQSVQVTDEPLIAPDPAPDVAPPPVPAPDVAPSPAPQPAPVGVDRWTFDDGQQGWGAGQAGDRVSREGSITHQGRGALRGRTKFGANATGTLRFRSEAGDRDWSTGGGKLGSWVLVPAGAGGSNWQARLEIQDGSRYAYSNGAFVSLTPGTWTYVSHDFGVKTRDIHRIAVHVQAWNVGGHRHVYIDTVRQTP